MTPRRRRAAPLLRARTRITAITLVCLVAVLCAGAALILNGYRRDLIDQVDDRLVSAASHVAPAASSTSSTTSSDVNYSVQAVDADGTVVFAGTPLVGLAALWVPGQPTQPHTVDTADGPLRVIVTPLRDQWIVLAQPLAPINDSIRTLRTTMAFALPLIVAGFGAVIWISVGRALRPVAVAMERERQLVIDASHELRSPLAGLRVLLETEPHDRGEQAENRRRVLNGVQRLETISDQLLDLGRAEGRSRRDVRPVDLDDVVRRTVSRLGDAPTARIDLDDVVAGQTLGVESELEGVVENLISNALRHATNTVKVTVTEDADNTLLIVDDDGDGIRAADRDRVFDRFTRLDEARARTTGGAGLGLAIVRANVEAHDGTVAVDESPLGGARFTVTLPTSTAHRT